MCAELSYKHGCQCWSEGKYVEGIRSFKTSLREYQNKGDTNMVADCYINIATFYQKCEKYSEAIDNYKQSLSIYQQRCDKVAIAYNFMMLADCYAEISMFYEGADNYKESLTIYEEVADHDKIAFCFLGLGKCYQNISTKSEAVSCFEKSLSIINKHNLDEKRKGWAYVGLASTYMDMHRYHDSQTYFEKALEIAQQCKDSELEFKCILVLADLNVGQEQFLKALTFAEQALRIAENINYTKGKCCAYNAFGNAYLKLGKFQEAIDCFERYLAYTKQVGNRLNEGYQLNILSRCYIEMSENDKAIDYSKKSLSIAKEVCCLDLEGKASQNIGNALQQNGEVTKAIQYHKKQKEIAIQLGDEEQEAAALNCLGNVCLSQSKVSEALGYFEQCKKLFSKLGREKAKGFIYNNLGNIQYRVGKYHEALKNYKQCILIYEEIHDISSQGKAYRNLALIYEHLDNFELSSECKWKHITIAIQTKNKIGEFIYWQELAECFGRNNNLHKAIKFSQKALKLALEIKHSEAITSCYQNIGFMYLKIGRIADAIRYLEMGLEICSTSKNRIGKGMLCHEMGALYNLIAPFESKGQKSANHFQVAETYLRESLQIFEEIFVDLKEQHNFKVSIVDTYTATYKSLALLLVDQNRSDEAILICDRGRACALGDALTSRYDVQLQQPTRLLLNNSDLSNILDNNSCIVFYFIFNELLKCWVVLQDQYLIDPFILDESLKQISSTLTAAISELVLLAYHSMDVRASIANNCEDRSLGNQEAQNSEDDENQMHLSQRITEILLEDGMVMPECRNPTTSRETTENGEQMFIQNEDIREPLKMLFKYLITPIQERLRDEIVIVPEGPLYRVPFAALQDPQTGQYLCKTKRIRIVPSMKTLHILKESPPEYHCCEGALVVGNPCVGEVMFRGKKERFRDLPAAETEAMVFGSILGVSPLIGKDATKDAFKAQLKEDVAIIHIAAHGDNDFGEIALAPGISANSKEIPEEEDYILTMHEVQEIGVRAKLVVLSCCHSGRGEIRAEGVVGMARAFLAAGASAVVASLWAISDEATLDFMCGFYTHLKNGESASESLNESMKELIREETYSHPKYWAPFVLIGDDVTIF